MSVQFGRWNLDGEPVDPTYLAKVKPLIAPYGPDDEGAYAISNLIMMYRAFHTTKESRRETQPHISESGVVITWDGRLDNRAELVRRLPGVLTLSATDISIVAAAYEEWGTNCFVKLLGDWALSLWDENSRSLILAKDPIGTRHLYYSIDNDQVIWTTILDPLVLLTDKAFPLCEEYIAGWFSMFPATHLTPYVGIHSVPPSSSVLIRAGKHTVRKYCDFDPNNRIHYHSDKEYEEHFCMVFSEAIRRRLRSDNPILAELSGGMDSSSIVCMADTLIRNRAAETPRLDTISYYNDSEPNWNERPYFEKVEAKRGRTGTHIDVGKQEPLNLKPDSDQFAATPGSGGRPSEISRQLAKCMTSLGNRVVLSGIGGDEVTGGVPTPTPELQDLFAKVRLMTLARQLTVWALNTRRPWFRLLLEAFRGFLSVRLVGVPRLRQPAAWLARDFVDRNRAALQGYESRIKLLGALPSFQGNLFTLETLQRQLACSALPLGPPYEKRYPYLDRDLLQFLFAIPREQLVRPGQRRSLMRRALLGIVPDELLNRKRKAYVTRAPTLAISREWEGMVGSRTDLTIGLLGIVDPVSFSEILQKSKKGDEIPVVSLLRTMGIERWLRHLGDRGLLPQIDQKPSGLSLRMEWRPIRPRKKTHRKLDVSLILRGPRS